MTDWAEEKAAAWLDMVLGPPGGVYHESCIASLAVLLREVAENSPVRDDDHIAVGVRRGTLAEVRRVVEDVWTRETYSDGLTLSAVGGACKEILSRLEKLS